MSLAPRDNPRSPACLLPGARCVPAYRTAFLYAYAVDTAAWLTVGSLCLGRGTARPTDGAAYLQTGIANATAAAHAARFGFAPCLRVPALEGAFRSARKYFLSLPLADRIAILR